MGSCVSRLRSVSPLVGLEHVGVVAGHDGDDLQLVQRAPLHEVDVLVDLSLSFRSSRFITLMPSSTLMEVELGRDEGGNLVQDVVRVLLEDGVLLQLLDLLDGHDEQGHVLR